jgi:UDP-N-acetylglucosamine 2-epimerase (non-hydrolysing)
MPLKNRAHSDRTHRASRAVSGKDNGMRVLMVFGTRPEAIKMAPIALELKSARRFTTKICCTAQHRSMVDEALTAFELMPDYDLGIMRPDQTLSGIASAVFDKLDRVLQDFRPDWVLVQGDTTTSMAAALASFHRQIAVGHVEAGLRTGDLRNPWPEEANRRITSIVTQRHYCPTERARNSLRAEGIQERDIVLTGNTVIDALQWTANRIASDPFRRDRYQKMFDWIDPERRMILVTGHRRESFGEGFRQICNALARLGRRDDVQVVYPVHLNPNVRAPFFEILSDSPAVHLIEPLGYEAFVWLMQHCSFILTDSGGIQEEAPTLGKPVLVMRATTERPEGIEAGVSKLVGTDAERIYAECNELLSKSELYRRMSQAKNPFGDGNAASRIVDDLMHAYV